MNMDGTNQPPHGFRFYVARVVSRREAKACEALRERGFTVHAPAETVWKRTRAGKRRELRPMLAGYLFVALDPQAPAFRQALEASPELKGFVGQGQPRAVPPGFVEGLAQAEAQGAFDRTRKAAKVSFAVGQPVKVVAGPFAGHVASFVAVRGQARAVVLLALLAVPTELDAAGLVAA